MGREGDADPVICGDDPRMQGVVDYRGRPLTSRSTSGGWISALFIIGVEIAERSAYYGISSNLITYLTGPLGQSTASAAANLNTWSGVASMLPLLGGFLADAYIGRYRTIVLSSLLYLLGLGMLTLSAVAPSLRPSGCGGGGDPQSCSPSSFQVTFFFFFSLYMVALAQGGHRPCLQAFGADQFDGNDPSERKSKGSFFNWWCFGLSLGSGATIVLLSYVQDSIGWGLGFGLPFATMAAAFAVFLMGTRTYRYHALASEGAFSELLQACAGHWRSWRRRRRRTASSDTEDCKGRETLLIHQERSLTSEAPEMICGKGVLRLFPIWATCLMYSVVFAQPPTLFTKQGSTMDRRLGPNILAPPAALQSFTSVSIVTFIPIYDRAFVPLARMVTGVPTGVTVLQRIGIGIVVSIAAMAVAAVVEMKRLQTAMESGLVDRPEAAVPMSLWWLVPQYVLYGISDVFTLIGLQEFFYDQVPDTQRSLGLAFFLSIFGFGHFISSFLVSAIDRVTRRSGDSWFADNLNRGHLDYFYWLLAVLSTGQLIIFLLFARSFRYKNGNVRGI